MIWDLIQQSQIHDARSQADSAKRRAENVRHDVAATQANIERLTLSCAAMWELLSEKLGVTTDDLMAKIEEIDLRDGKLDGRKSSPKHACSKCGRKNKGTRRQCLFCGNELPADPF